MCVCVCGYKPCQLIMFSLLHDNAQPHTSIKTRKTVTSFKWTTLPHPPYSPDLAPSDYHLFNPVKEGLRNKHYACDKEVKTAVMKLLKERSTEFHEAGVHALIWRLNIAIERKSDNVEKEGYDPQRTSFILMYGICSCVINYSYTKGKKAFLFDEPS